MTTWRRLGAILAAASILAALLGGTIATDAQEAATPVPLPNCDPAPNLLATPQPDDEDQFPFGTMITRDSIRVLVTNLMSCRNDRDWDAWIALVTPALLEQIVGTEDTAIAKERFDRLAMGGYLQTVEIMTVQETEITHRRGTASTVVTWLDGTALKRERWSFIGSSEGWMLTGIEPLSPLLRGGAVGLVVEILPGSLITTRNTITDSGMIVFETVNRTNEPQTLTIYTNPGRLAADELATALTTAQPRTPRVAAHIAVSPGDTAFLPVVELPPGDYALVVEHHELWSGPPLVPPWVWLLTVA